jgi:short-subunit dehydrogenase
MNTELSDDPHAPVIIITGASSGIGKALALEYARAGGRVVLAARRADRLEEVAAEAQSLSPITDATFVVPTDVTDPEAVQALVDRTFAKYGQIDVMINNAGYGQFGRVWELSAKDLRDIFEVNFFGAFFGSKAAAKVMLAQGFGHIFNVSSVIGHVGSPFHGAYSASKFALAGLTEALRVELFGTGIHVTDVCPALTATEFFDHVRDGQPRRKSDFLRKKKRMPAATVARKMVTRTGRRTPRLVFTAGGRFLMMLSALWPRVAERLLKVYRDDLASCLTSPDKPA